MPLRSLRRMTVGATTTSPTAASSDAAGPAPSSRQRRRVALRVSASMSGLGPMASRSHPTRRCTSTLGPTATSWTSSMPAPTAASWTYAGADGSLRLRACSGGIGSRPTRGAPSSLASASPPTIVGCSASMSRGDRQSEDEPQQTADAMTCAGTPVGSGSSGWRARSTIDGGVGCAWTIDRRERLELVAPVELSGVLELYRLLVGSVRAWRASPVARCSR